jgi:hypothetical protein
MINITLSEQYVRLLRGRFIVYILLTGLMNLFFWYYMIVFCSVYRLSAVSWMGSSLKTLAIDMLVFDFIRPLAYVMVRVVCKKWVQLK